MGNVTIKKGSVTVTVPRKDLIEVNETHDGVMFNCKSCHFYVTDNSLPLTTKVQIKASFDMVKEGDVLFDMDNYHHPVSVSIPTIKK
jgi:hypothetical protein